MVVPWTSRGHHSQTTTGGSGCQVLQYSLLASSCMPHQLHAASYSMVLLGVLGLLLVLLHFCSGFQVVSGLANHVTFVLAWSVRSGVSGPVIAKLFHCVRPNLG